MWIGFNWLREGTVAGCCEHSNELADDMIGGEFLDDLNDC
jgi:hypothetical protein